MTYYSISNINILNYKDGFNAKASTSGRECMGKFKNINISCYFILTSGILPLKGAVCRN